MKIQTTHQTFKMEVEMEKVPANTVFLSHGTAFFKLEKPIRSGFTCSDCGVNGWNVHNFVCAVHFCPTKKFNIELTEFKVDASKFELNI